MTGRRTVARGIYADANGYQIQWRAHGENHSKRFPADTPLKVLKAWRRRKVGTAAPPEGPAGSFARDVAAFLRSRRGRPTYASDRTRLKAWLARFRTRSRWAITRELVQAAVDDWRRDKYSARELRHRVQILRRLFRHFDPGEPTPCDGIQLPAVPHARPISVADGMIRQVAAALRASEVAGRLRDAKTRARFLVLATTGQRPAQLQRAQPIDVDLARGIWFVRPAKGDRGTVLYLNAEMRAAWELFIAAQAWGRYTSFGRVLRHHGWPAGVTPYALRHTIGMRLSELGVDLGDIQAALGHSTPALTRRFYVPGVPARLKAASAQLEGRLGAPDIFSVAERAGRKTRGRKRTEAESLGNSRTAGGQKKGRFRVAAAASQRRRSSKTA